MAMVSLVGFDQSIVHTFDDDDADGMGKASFNGTHWWLGQRKFKSSKSGVASGVCHEAEVTAEDLKPRSK